MKREQENWLEEYAVTCRVFKGRWSIRHCVKMYNDIRDLKIRMSSRFKGQVARHESQYNPCENCKVLTRYIEHECNTAQTCDQRGNRGCNEVWAV